MAKSFFHKEKKREREKEKKREREKEKIIGETMSSSFPVILYREDDIIKKSCFSQREKEEKREREKRK